MPTISVEMFEGRSRAQKEDFVERVTQAAVESLGGERSAVRVKFNEVRRSNSAEGGVLGVDPE